MLRVGLTGGLGSGKSTAAQMFASLGAYLSQSDEVARELMAPGQPAYSEIVRRFGTSVLRPDGTLDRSLLAKLAFAEGQAEALNAIIHPLVLRAQADWAAEVATRDPRAIAMVESALIFETKHTPGDSDAPWRTRFDRIVVVTAHLALRRSRYVARLNVTEEALLQAASADFDRRAELQWTDERKSALADYILHNNGSREALEAQVNALWTTLQKESAGRAEAGL